MVAKPRRLAAIAGQALDRTDQLWAALGRLQERLVGLPPLPRDEPETCPTDLESILLLLEARIGVMLARAQAVEDRL
jgi:hypothetical protein